MSTRPSRACPATCSASASSPTDGRVHAAGDVDTPFALMSVAKPFVFALACEALGPEAVGQRVGVNATGLPFNAAEAVERSPAGRTNPMVNPGAIATTSLVPGRTAAAKWEAMSTVSRASPDARSRSMRRFRSASATNHVNRELTALLSTRAPLLRRGRRPRPVHPQSCLSVTARDLAVMGATLADGGVNPVTGDRVVAAALCHHVLAVMSTAGLYETSGDWLYDIGLPAKSGIGGGIVTCRRARAVWGHSPRRSTQRATA